MTSNSEIRIDPEFAALIPPLTPEESQGLEVSLLTEGCRDPLLAWNGVLLDGHSRHKICTAHNIPFEVRQMAFDDRDAAKRWIILNQFARRNLTLFQRAELAIKLKPIIAAKAKEKQRQAGGPVPSAKAKDKQNQEDGPLPMVATKAPIDTRKEVAKAANISEDAVAKAEFIDKHADAETKKKLLDGKLKLGTAVKEIKARQAGPTHGKAASKPAPKTPRKITCECGHVWTPTCPKCKRPYSR